MLEKAMSPSPTCDTFSLFTPIWDLSAAKSSVQRKLTLFLTENNSARNGPRNQPRLASAGWTGIFCCSFVLTESDVCDDAGDPGIVGVSAFSVTEDEGTEELVWDAHATMAASPAWTGC